MKALEPTRSSQHPRSYKGDGYKALTVIPALSTVIPALSTVIPAKAGIHHCQSLK